MIVKILDLVNHKHSTEIANGSVKFSKERLHASNRSSICSIPDRGSVLAHSQRLRRPVGDSHPDAGTRICRLPFPCKHITIYFPDRVRNRFPFYFTTSYGSSHWPAIGKLHAIIRPDRLCF
jgi:hypothetical protein